jgi:hypothetical protein
LDQRYWEYGGQWILTVSVGDTVYENGDRPIIYRISVDMFRGTANRLSEEMFIKQCNSVIENMSSHFNNNNFMNGFDMNREKYGECRLHYTTKAWKRKQKINELGI